MATEVEEIRAEMPRRRPARVLIVVEVPNPSDDDAMITKEFEASADTTISPYRVAKGLVQQLDTEATAWLSKQQAKVDD